MNFGPLNRAGGERRLNVAVTRAIREVVVFASFDPDMIDLTRTSAQAVHDLKTYLDFAQRGQVALARQVSVAGGDEFESAFEEHVAMRLRSKGWTIQTQVGVSRFRIDLGVVHPDHAGRFLAGVECDGATFHSSPTARDRDRVRHGVLTALGWQLIRLWSTDFFLDPDAAIASVDVALKELLERDREEAARQIANTGTARASEAVEDPVSVDEIDDRSVDLAEDDGDGRESPASAMLPNTDRAEEVAVRGSGGWSEASVADASDRVTNPVLGLSDAPLRAYAPQFYDEGYRKLLRPVCLEQIDRLGPITFVHLSERIARAHGFQRTGSEIKKQIWAAVGRQRQSTKAPDGAVTFWPEHLRPSSHVPYRGDVVAGESRPWHSTPYVEKLGLAVDIVASYPAENRMSEMARRVGVMRLRTKTRDEIIELLESASGMAH